MTSRIVVVGDSMLDVDIDGVATRLSPEGPVPVVDGDQVGQRPGGAGLAAALAARHGADVVLVTAIGDDPHGDTLRRLLEECGVALLALPMSGSTVCKTRIRANGHNIVRLDQGSGTAGPVPLSDALKAVLGSSQAVMAADYGRGICADAGLRELLSEVAGRLPVVWDPHPRGSEPIAGATLVTPNEAEAQHFSHSAPDSPSSVEALRRRWHAEAVCVTLGQRGAMLAGATHGITHLEPTVRVPVRGDACGAGDRFAIAAVCALAEGADVLAAATHAVDAASRFVAAGGASAMSRVTELAARDIVGGPDHVPGVASITDDLEGLAARLRRSGGTVVATGGCFDLLHTGHVRLLHRARELGSALVVLLNSDESVRTLKGPSRPVMPAVDRARVLAALGCVDAVCIFDEVSPEAALQRLRPDVWVKGGDYTEEQLPEAAVVRTHGGDVVILPTVPGYSSSNLIAAARS